MALPDPSCMGRYDRTGVPRIIQSGSEGQTGFCYFLACVKCFLAPEQVDHHHLFSFSLHVGGISSIDSKFEVEIVQYDVGFVLKYYRYPPKMSHVKKGIRHAHKINDQSQLGCSAHRNK
jgi:hypothetical protein